MENGPFEEAFRIETEDIPPCYICQFTRGNMDVFEYNPFHFGGL